MRWLALWVLEKKIRINWHVKQGFVSINPVKENPNNLALISVSGLLQIVILIYWPCVQKNGGTNYLTSFPIAVTSMISRTLWFGEVHSTENTVEGNHGKSYASAAYKRRQPPHLHPGSPLNQRTRKCTSATSTQ